MLFHPGVAGLSIQKNTVVFSDGYVCAEHALDVWGSEDLWELGGDREGPGNRCIFNGRESKGSGARPRVKSWIIDRTTDTETLKVCEARVHKNTELYTHTHTHLSACHMPTHVSICWPGPEGAGYRELRRLTGRHLSAGMKHDRHSHKHSIPVLPTATDHHCPLVSTPRLVVKLS